MAEGRGPGAAADQPGIYHAWVFLGRRRSVPDLCSDLADATVRLDEKASTRAFRALTAWIDQAGEADLSAGLRNLAPAVRQVALGNGGLLAQLTAGMVEAGADPFAIVDVLVERVSQGLEHAARFPEVAGTLGGDVRPPASKADVDRLEERVIRAAPTLGLTVEEAGQITMAWFTINDWIPGLLLPLQQKRVRQALPQRARLTVATEAMADHADDAPWLLGLLRVLDDEPLIVVHRDSGHVYDVTISGVGDNFQLHTLLAAALIGDPAQGMIVGTPPHPTWIAAATDGEMAPTGGIRGQFNLVDATGEWIWNEGRPADIPTTAGRRVVVIDPPLYERTWNIGRAYPLMVPEMHLHGVMPADTATAWVHRIHPPRPR